MRSIYNLDDFVGEQVKIIFLYGDLSFHSEGTLYRKGDIYGCGTATFRMENVVRIENGTIRLRVVV